MEWSNFQLETNNYTSYTVALTVELPYELKEFLDKQKTKLEKSYGYDPNIDIILPDIISSIIDMLILHTWEYCDKIFNDKDFFYKFKFDTIPFIIDETVNIFYSNIYYGSIVEKIIELLCNDVVSRNDLLDNLAKVALNVSNALLSKFIRLDSINSIYCYKVDLDIFYHAVIILSEDC